MKMLSLSLGVSRMNRIRIESIRGTVKVRSQRPERGGLDASTGWDGEAEPADLSTAEALTEETWQAGGLGEARRRDFVDGAKEDMSVRKEDGVKGKRVIGCADA